MSVPETHAEWPSDATLTPVIETALAEDVGAGDVTTSLLVPSGLSGTGRIVAKSPCVAAGVRVVALTYDVLHRRFGAPEIRAVARATDGSPVGQGARLVELEGSYGALLTGERVALNLLSHLVGVATLTARFVGAVAGTGAKIVDTRKTLPGMRSLEKYAVRCGGGTNHRRGLDDAILVKENHVAAAGGMENAVRRVTAMATGLPSMFEVRSLEEAEVAVSAGARALLLDNMSVAEVGETLARIRRLMGAGGDGGLESQGTGAKDGDRVVFEVSGGLSLERVRAYAALGVDRLSIGALTHSAPAADLSMLVTPVP